MRIVVDVVEGETARIIFPLFEDGAALDGTGFTVSDLIITARDGLEQVNTAGDFGWVSESAGTVYYDPDASDFVASKAPYRVRVKITDGNDKVRYYPNEFNNPAVIRVSRVGA